MTKKANPGLIINQPDSLTLDINPEDINKTLSKIRIKDDIKVVFFGNPSFVDCVLEDLEENFNVVGVVRDKELTEDLALDLESKEPDLFIVAAFGKIIPESFLKIPKFGSLNIHPSLLPIYRGPSPIQAALLNGDKETGVTIIKIDASMDHGPILDQKSFIISDQDNLETLSNKLFQEGSKMLVKLIPDFVEGKIALKEQNHSKATFCKLVKREDGYFPIDNPPASEKLDRMIRAYYPWPGVWTRFRGKTVKFFPDGKVQMEGKKVTPLSDFLRGYPDFPLREL